MSKPLIIVGGSGHGVVVASVINDNRKFYPDYEWEVKGFVNDYDERVDNYPVLGKLCDIPKLIEAGYYFVWCIHLIQRNMLTKQLYDKCSIPSEKLATIIHHSAFVGEHVVFEPGVVVMPHAYVASNSHFGESTMIKANTSIGHDVRCKQLCHFSMGSITGSFSQIGLCSDVATGANVSSFIKIGDYAMAGASSLVTHDIPNGEIHIGVPAKLYKRTKTD